MRYLGIDYGARRTGLAVCDANEMLVSPLTCLENNPKKPDLLMQQIKKIIAENQIDALVVGLPLNMDDSAGPQADLASKFADRLRKTFSLPVHLHDERLSSAAADEKLGQIDGLSRRRKKNARDMLAACEILQDFIDNLHNGRP